MRKITALRFMSFFLAALITFMSVQFDVLSVQAEELEVQEVMEQLEESAVLEEEPDLVSEDTESEPALAEVVKIASIELNDEVLNPVYGQASPASINNENNQVEIMTLTWVSEENPEFVAGDLFADETYTVKIGLSPRDGYEFNVVDGEYAGDVLINGQTAGASLSDGLLVVSYQFAQLEIPDSEEATEETETEEAVLEEAKEAALASEESEVLENINDPQHTITFNLHPVDEADGASGTMSNVVVNDKDTYVFPASTFTAPTGKEFAYWSVAGVHYEVADELVIYDDVTVWAEFRPIESGIRIDPIPEQDYTGKEITPKVYVYMGSTLLKENQNYTVTYKNNIKPAKLDAMKKGKSVAPTVVITGRGNYSGKYEQTFTIKKVDMSEVTIKDIYKNYSGEKIKIDPEAKHGKTKLVKDTDFYITLSGNKIKHLKDEGVYTLDLVGCGDYYTGTKSFTFTITRDRLVSHVAVNKIPKQWADGTPKCPVPRLAYRDKGIPATDFNFTYSNNVLAGTASILITPKPGTGYVGSKTVTFTIVGRNIQRTELKGEIAEHVYDGLPYEPVFSLKMGTTTLYKDTDFLVTYKNNTKVGTATAEVTGIGHFTGNKTIKFKIVPYDARTDSAHKITVSNVGTPVDYAKGGVKIAPVVQYAGVTLEPKKDYMLSFRRNNAPGLSSAGNAPTVYISFIGNFKGVKSVPFTINKKDIGLCTFTASDVVNSGKDYSWKQKSVTIVDTNGNKLKAGTDYNAQVHYYDDAACTNCIDNDPTPLSDDTDVYVKVSGAGYYYGDIVGSYRVSKTSIGKAVVVTPASVYTGSPVVFTDSDFQVTLGRDTLNPGVDFEIDQTSYKKNINKGTGYVLIRGIGNYCGSKTVTFKIRNQTLYCSVRYHANGGTGKDKLQQINSILGILSKNTYTRKGYTFVEWNTQADGSGTTYSNMQLFGTTNKKGRITDLYAQWAVVPYTITYVLRMDGANNSSNPVAYDIEDATITLAPATMAGKTFVGWYSDPRCTRKVTEIKTGTYGNLTLYAKWN